MFGAAGESRSIPNEVRKSNIYAMIWRKSVGISVDSIVASQAIWKSGADGELDVGFEVFVFGQVVLKKHGHIKKAVGWSWYEGYGGAGCVS